jgi:DNA-directed RNA polymerase subunit H (RpoH/RPB5)
MWNDLENMEENCERIWKIQTKIVKWYGKYGKSKLNSEKIWLMRKKSRLNSEKTETIWKKPKLNREKIWKIHKQIVKWSGKYGGKVCWIVKRYG